MIRQLVLFLLVFCTVPIPSLLAGTAFEYQDLNGDGKLSRNEFRGPPFKFKKLDSNVDQYISLEEAAGTRLLRSVNSPPSSHRAQDNGVSVPLVYVDTHNHLVGKRVMGTINFTKAVQSVLAAMDSAGVKHCLLLPMPQTVNQKLRLTFEDLTSIREKYPDRFGLLGGGGTLNVMIQEALHDGYVSEELIRSFDARVEELVEKGAVGFGEMTAEHFSMDPQHPYETAPPDHPLFLRLADFAAQYDLPIDLHMEAIPEEMPMPGRFQKPPNPELLQENIEAFGRLLAHNRNANIIWVHQGWCNTGKRTVSLTRKLLQENPNLYLSLRIASGMQKRKVAHATFPLNRDGRLKAEWLKLFEDFPDRFCIGSDEIVKPDNSHPSSGSIRSTVSLLEQLPPKLQALIGYENANRIYKL